jgi:small nuclear ribonucleoprotein (snRNP)-like protein
MIVALLVGFPMHTLLAGGAEVVVHLKNEQQFVLELYSVNDSLLTLRRGDASGQSFYPIMFQEIQKVTLKDRPKVLLVLKDGWQISGQLDSVDDSALVISDKKTTLRGGSSEFISKVRNQEIQKVIVKGQSKILNGMALGLLIGAGSMVVIGLASGDDDSFLRGIFNNIPIVFGGAGLVVGGVAGAATSTRGMETEFSVDKPFSFLRLFAKHK